MTVYAQSRWPTRAVAAFFVAVGSAFIPTGPLALVIVFVAMGVLFLVGGERRRIRVSPDGIESVPPLGRKHAYAWSDIDGFVARRYVAKYSGWVASVSVNGRWVDLPATRRASLSTRTERAVQGVVDQLNEGLHSARGGR